MKLFNNNIVPYVSTEGDKIYPIVVDIKKGLKSGEAISFVTADNQVGVITVDFMDGNSSYSIEDCIVTSTIHRPDGTVLEIPCDIISQSTIEIPLGINGTYQEGVHTFDLKIVRGNGKVIGVPTMSYSVLGSLSSDDVVEGDDRLPVLTMVLDNAQDKLTRLDKAIAGATNDLEVKEARDGEVTLNARLERDLAKGKIHFVDIEGSNIATESEEGYLENVEILGNTWQNANNLSDIRSVGDKVEGQELYEIPVLSCGKNLFNGKLENGYIYDADGTVGADTINCVRVVDFIRVNPNTAFTLKCNGANMDKIYYYDKDKNFISLLGIYSKQQTVVTPSNCSYIKVRFYSDSGLTPENVQQFQIEGGTQATPYEPYQEDKLTILSPTPLEKVGDVADRIICKDGVLGIEKNIETIFLKDVKGTWAIAFNNENTISFRVENVRNAGTYSCICNKLPDKSKYNADEEGIWFDHNLIVTLNKNVGVDSVDKFKSWINSENVYVISTGNNNLIPLPHNQQIKLRTFADRTNISFLTEIEPTLKAQVPKSLGATVNSHTSQIDNLNKELDRVKKLEESTVSTVTSDKAFTTVAETTQGYFEDVKVEGKTLVNLSSVKSQVVKNSSGFSRFCNVITNKSISKFVLSVDVSNVIGILKVYIKFTDGTELYPYTVNENGRFTKLFDFGKPIQDVKLYVDTNDTDIAELDNIIILEGDHTDKDISFFEGLKSVGQDTDEISVSSVNGNGNLVEYIELNGVSSGAGEDYTNIIYVRTNYITVEPNQTYYIKHSTNVLYKDYVVYFYDSNKSYLGYKFGLTSEFTTVANTKFIRIDMKKADGTANTQEDINNCDFVVSKCSVSEYIPYQSDKKRLLYYNPNTQTWGKPILREWDSIEKHSDGKYYYHKRSGEVVFTGGERWALTSVTYNNVLGFYTTSISDFASGLNNKNVISDKFITSNYLDDEEGITSNNDNSSVVRIKIKPSKLSTQDVAGFTQWLQANPTTVVYQLAKEEVYECTNLDLITYQNETNLIVNSGAIQPRLKLKVLSNISNVVKLLQEKVSILENKFINGLKQVLAGDMMSLAHLLYPEDFENNHEIQTLEL